MLDATNELRQTNNPPATKKDESDNSKRTTDGGGSSRHRSRLPSPLLVGQLLHGLGHENDEDYRSEARALASVKRNDPNRVTKTGPSGTRMPIKSPYGPNHAYKPARGGYVGSGSRTNDDDESGEKKTEKLQALGKGKTTGASGRTGEADAAYGVHRIGLGWRSNIDWRGEAVASLADNMTDSKMDPFHYDSQLYQAFMHPDNEGACANQAGDENCTV